MNVNRFFWLLPAVFISLIFVPSAHAGRRGGGGGGVINKLSGPGPFYVFSGFYTFSKNKEIFLNVGGAYARSFDNDLEYPAGVQPPAVNAVSANISVDFKVPVPRLELGVGYGFHYFYGGGFDGFGRHSFDLLRAGVRLYRDDKVEGIRFRLQGTASYLPQGFDAEDFGAIPGTFEVDTEVVFGVALIFVF